MPGFEHRTPRPTPGWLYPLQIVVLALLYFLAGKASFSLAVSHNIVTLVVFAAEGFALAATIIWGPRLWPGVFLGQLVLALANGLAWELAVAISITNSLEAVIGSLLFRRFALHFSLDRMRDIAGLLLMITVILQPFSATCGNAILWLGGVVSTADLGVSWVSWWLGNSLGQIIVVPMLLSLYQEKSLEHHKLPAFTLTLAATLAGSWLVFKVPQFSSVAFGFAICTPLLVLLASKFGMTAASFCTFLITVLTLFYTKGMTGPFVDGAEIQILDLNIFLLGIALTSQFVAALFQEIRARRDDLNEAQAIARVGSWTLNIRNREFRGSAEFHRIFGTHADTPIPFESLMGRIHPDDRMFTIKSWETAMQGDSHNFEYRVIVDDGIYWLATETRLYRDTNGTPLNCIGTVQDITERKQVELLKSEFISTVSHELRTPLTAISGSLGLISGGALGEVPEKFRQMLTIAHQNSLRLINIINDLLDIERLAAGKMPFDLREQAVMPIIDSAIENNRAYADKYQVRYRVTQRADDASVTVDSIRLHQALENLLSNAAKFSRPGSEVDIGVSTVDDHLRIDVVDYGAGIPVEFHDRIFQKFSQADATDSRTKGGTGLGLAISKDLVEKMGGTIRFASEEGQGSTFSIELPLASG